MTPKRIVALVLAGLALIVVVAGGSQLVENVDAGEIVVCQSAFGNLQVWKTPGPKMQMFGKVTKYRKSTQFWFSTKPDQGEATDQSMKLRFNDGGHGNLSGSIRFDMPLDDGHILAIHSTYGSQEAVEKQLIRTNMEKAVYFAGPLMSSTQSFAERRNDLIGYIDDMATNGIYKSSQECSDKQIDPITKQEKTVCKVKLETGPDGKYIRVEPSPLAKFSISQSNLSVNDIDYDPEVKAQIKAQQAAIASVQTSVAEARKAEQRAITVAKDGEADAAKAKWTQEAIKAKLVTEAEQQKEVARLNKEAAEFTKQKDILEGEGEAAKRKLIMTADGALDKKLAAFVEVNKAYAAALGQQPLVPSVIMGNGTSGSTNATDLVQMLTARSARELALDMGAMGSSTKVAERDMKKR